MCETESLSPCHCSAGNDSIIPTSSLTQEEPITRAQDCCLWSVCFISQITVVPVEEEWLLRLRNTLSESYRAPCGHVECVINKNLTHRPNKTRKESQEESETVTVTPNIQTAASLHTELTGDQVKLLSLWDRCMSSVENRKRMLLFFTFIGIAPIVWRETKCHFGLLAKA